MPSGCRISGKILGRRVLVLGFSGCAELGMWIWRKGKREKGKKRHLRRWKLHDPRHEGRKVQGVLEKQQIV